MPEFEFRNQVELPQSFLMKLVDMITVSDWFMSVYADRAPGFQIDTILSLRAHPTGELQSAMIAKALAFIDPNLKLASALLLNSQSQRIITSSNLIIDPAIADIFGFPPQQGSVADWLLWLKHLQPNAISRNGIYVGSLEEYNGLLQTILNSSRYNKHKPRYERLPFRREGEKKKPFTKVTLQFNTDAHSRALIDSIPNPPVR